jgi:putative NADH-flavin reductase
MRLAVFGATGRAGSAVVERAVADGHRLHVLARQPASVGSSPDVTVTGGDVRDPSCVARVVGDADAVVSALGGTRADNPGALEQGTSNILAAMEKAGLRRLVVIQGFHLTFPGDPANPGRRLVQRLLHTLARPLAEDSLRMAARLQASPLDWTLIRMPPLRVVSSVGAYRVGTLRLGPWSHVTTGQVADLAARCLSDGTYVRQAPMIASARRRTQPSAASDSVTELPAGRS